VKKDLNFDLNIMPVIDILSVLITFLLLTAVWVEMGSIDVRQAVGDNALSGQNPPSIWATVNADGSVSLSLRDIKVRMQNEFHIAGRGNQVDWNRLSSTLQSLKNSLPDLKTAVIRPTATTNYGDVIRVMDAMKKNQVNDIGLSPLG
jgi:biopolymer transport protein ExbD